MAGMKRRFVPLVALVTLSLLCACASRRYEDDKTDPNYQSGALFPMTVPAQQQGYSGGEATVGLVASAIALAANRDYYKSSALTGKCLCRDSAGENLALPCGNVTVVITDPAGKPLTRTQTASGEFAFRVQPKASYRLEIESDRYRLEKRKPDREYQLGDDVILHLVRK